MRGMSRVVCISATLTLSAGVSQAQTSTPSDVYHVMFVKAAPGQAATLAKELLKADPKSSGHVLLLRHQEGADWDYCVIEHLGPKTSVEITAPPPEVRTPTRAWHDDTFVAGPAWPEFQKAMGLENPGNAVYIVGIHRAVPGHRTQLLESLRSPNPGSKVTVGNIVMPHVEGGAWQFLTITRYNSWQDFATDRAAAAADGWTEVRQHSAFHTDTIADRVR